MAQQPISIIGAGIGGLTLARCLLKHGIPAVLYERAKSPVRSNYGITLHASSYQPLLKVLNMNESSFKHRIAVNSGTGGSGEINPKAIVPRANWDENSFRAHRGKLENLLLEGLHVQRGHNLEKIEHIPSGMRLVFKNGEVARPSCVIGVDGPHSHTRRSLPTDPPLKILPFVAFNGTRQIKRTGENGPFEPSFQNSNIVEMKQGQVILNVSISDLSADEISVSWIYSRPAQGSTDTLHRPNRPTSKAMDIPPEFYQEIRALKNLEQPFKEVFDADKIKDERVLHWLMRNVIVSLEDLHALAKKKIFFMGDAIHAEPILGGEGANVAIRDGVELAECISTKGVDGISAWYDERYVSWQEGVERSEEAIAEMHGVQKASL